MALAILEPLGVRDGVLELRVDTGANDRFALRIGRSRTRRDGIEWVDDVYHDTGLTPARAGRDILDTTTTVSLPLSVLERGRAHAQLFSFRGDERRSPSYSDVVLLPAAGLPFQGITMSASGADVLMVPTPSRRAVPCRTAAQHVAITTSVPDILGEVLRVVGPVVAQLLGGTAAGGTAAAAAGGAGNGVGGTAQLLAGLLQSVVAALGGGAPAPPPATTAASTAASIGGNRFSRPFVFGIDDALIGAVLGNLAGVLPELLPALANAGNQERLQARQSHDALVGRILDGMRQQQLVDRLAEAVEAGGSGGGSDATSLAPLLALLQQAAARPAAAPAAAPPAAAATTQSVFGPGPGSLSARAVLSVVTGDPLPFGGREVALFATEGPVRLRVRFDVGQPVPTEPLPRSVLRTVVKQHEGQHVLHEQEQRLLDLAPGTVVDVELGRPLVEGLPHGQRLDVCHELRWPAGRGAVRRALGSGEIVLAAGPVVTGSLRPVGDERELVDLTQHRDFWHRVWASPVLDAPAGGRRMTLWELDATLRYTVVVTGQHDSNGVMETRVKQVEETLDTVTERTRGRVRTGVELSVQRLAELTALWPDAQLATPEELAALSPPEVTAGLAADATRPVRLRGTARERGELWVGPVLRLHEVPVAMAGGSDEFGQVQQLAASTVRLPLPVGIRLLGIVSADGQGSTGPRENEEGPGYRFDGYDIELYDRVGLMDPTAAPSVVSV